ncbi:TetR/AcrR family transcriptional regulator [Clostridium fermenticellae]|uniref:TetR/AcrR family transcriptional regulator n=1 Tax=Clostridium fermenticellae TaxID=2068654 RepID=A0A386H5Z2_9CLOT|nr:TetR/AcrR family transcriptional regulator [Clostridium fermenticellae]AYD41070.1 TetR/AcrR family transcriptional regulator [Clostridium fermenticellae]
MDNKKRITSRKLQAIERRQQLLDSAKKLFAKNGYYNTSVHSITNKIGMADGLIYHYFPKGKLEILHTILRDGCNYLVNHVNDTLQGVTDDMTLDDVMLYFCNELRNTVMLDSELIIIMLQERDLLRRETREIIFKMFSNIWIQINNFIKDRYQKGEIKEMDFRMVTHQFMSIIGSTVMMKFLFPDLKSEDTSKYIEELVKFTTDSWKN